MLVGAVSVTLDLDNSLRVVSVDLMGHTQLVPPDDGVLGFALPSGATDEVLSPQTLEAEDAGGGGHGDEVGGGHGVPHFVEEGAVVDDEGGGDAFGETFPVLRWGIAL